MRRIIGMVLLGFSAFLLVVGLFAQFFLPGVAKKTPLDVNVLQNLAGTGSYLGSTMGRSRSGSARRTPRARRPTSS